MAALTEEDLEKILGADFRAIELAAQKSTGVEEQQREIASSISAAEDKNFTSFASIFVGIALVFSCYYTSIKGTGFWVQMAIAIAFILVGIASWFHFRSKIANWRTELETLKANKAKA